MSASQSRNKRAGSGWILGWWQDLLLFIGTPVLICPLIFGANALWSRENILFTVVSFGALGHHVPGLMRAYGDRALFQRYRWRFILVPIFSLALCLLFTLQELSGVRLVIILWGFWHFLMQTYGFARIYDAKVGCLDALTRRIDFAMCLSWFAAAVLNSPSWTHAFVTQAYRSGLPFVPHHWIESAASASIAVAGVVTCLFAWNCAVKWSRGRPFSPAKTLLFAVTFGFYWFCQVSLANLVLGIAMFEIYHDVQYLSIVWMFNRNRVQQDPHVGSFTRFLFRRSGALLGLYLGLVFAYGAIGFGSELIPSGNFKNVILAVIATSNLLHFYYDGFIWKIREPSTGASLGVTSDEQRAQRQWSLPNWRNHGIKWAALGIVVAALGFAGYTGKTSSLAEAEAVAATVPDSSAAHVSLAEIYLSEKQFGKARQEAERALKVDPDGYRAHELMGMASFSLGQWSEAIKQLRKSVDLHWHNPNAHYELGLVLSGQGNLDEATQSFHEAIRLNPAYPEAYNELGRIYAIVGERETAKRYLTEALRLRPGFALPQSHLGTILSQEGKTEQAIARFRKAIEADPEFADAYLSLAELHKSIGDRRQSNLYLSEFRKLRPDDPRSRTAND